LSARDCLPGLLEHRDRHLQRLRSSRSGGVANDPCRRASDDHRLRIEIFTRAAVDGYADQPPRERWLQLDGCRHTRSDVASKCISSTVRAEKFKAPWRVGISFTTMPGPLVHSGASPRRHHKPSLGTLPTTRTSASMRRRYALSAYDAAYFEFALRLELPLAARMAHSSKTGLPYAARMRS